MATPRFGLAELVEGQAGGEVSVNELARRLEALLNPCILDRDLATPPGSPTSGDLYLVATSPTGAWTGQAGKLALYLAGAWYFFDLKKGVPYWVADEGRLIVYDGTTWAYLDATKDAFRHVSGGGGISAYYCAGVEGGYFVSGSATPSANVLRAFPFVAPSRKSTLDRIAVNVTTLAAGNLRLGIYEATSRTNLYPAGLVSGSDAGAISTGTTGVKENTISISMKPGELYWFAHLGDAAPTFRGQWISGAMQIFGIPTGLGTSPTVGLSVAYTYGALPSTFPASASGISSEPNIAIFGRFSA